MSSADGSRELRRALGWPTLAAYGLGAILGAGIYSVIGAAAARVGDGMWMSFAASSLVALVTALSYAELATMYPRAGAEFLYVRHALPRRGALAFTAGTMMACAAAATAATVAIAFAGYLGSFVDVPPFAAAPLLVAVLTGVAILGVKESVWMTAIFTVIEAAGLVIVVVAGATSPRFGAALATAPTLDVLPGAAMVFFSFLGFENIVNLAGETKRPARNLPIAILVSLSIAAVLYVLVALAAVALMPAAELAHSAAPLADAVGVRSPALAGALGGVGLFATANTAMAAIVSGSRIVYAMAEARELPVRLSAVLDGRRTPWLATLAVAAVAGALLPMGEVAVVASISSFASLFAFAVVNASLVVLRRRDPEHVRPFRVPGAIRRVPVLPLFGALCALLLLTQLERLALLSGAALLVLAVVTYHLLHGSRTTR